MAPMHRKGVQLDSLGSPENLSGEQLELSDLANIVAQLVQITTKLTDAVHKMEVRSPPIGPRGDAIVLIQEASRGLEDLSKEIERWQTK